VAERVTGKDEIFDMRPSMGYDNVSVFMNEAGVGIYCLLGRQNTNSTRKATSSRNLAVIAK